MKSLVICAFGKVLVGQSNTGIFGRLILEGVFDAMHIKSICRSGR